MKIKILYNVDGTSNDKPNNYDEWIDALKIVLTNKGVDISSIGANMIGLIWVINQTITNQYTLVR